MSVHVVKRKPRGKQLTERQIVAMFIARKGGRVYNAELWKELALASAVRPDLLRTETTLGSIEDVRSRGSFGSTGFNVGFDTRSYLTPLGRAYLRLKCGNRA